MFFALGDLLTLRVAWGFLSFSNRVRLKPCCRRAMCYGVTCILTMAGLIQVALLYLTQILLSVKAKKADKHLSTSFIFNSDYKFKGTH